MIKDREVGKDKRTFKVNPRAHVGYLVGYVASNIYRIWVPELKKVIITRNVTFNESHFYQPHLEQTLSIGIQDKQTLVANIEEEYEQALRDVGAQIENVGLVDKAQTEQIRSTDELLGGGPDTRRAEDEVELQTTDIQNSGVALLGKDSGLLSPEQTPAPEGARGVGDTSNGVGSTESVQAQEEDFRVQEDYNLRTTFPQVVLYKTPLSSGPAQANRLEAARSVERAGEQAATSSENESVADSLTDKTPQSEPERAPRKKYERRTWGPATRVSKRLQKRDPKDPDSDGGLGGGAGQPAIYAVLNTDTGEPQRELSHFLSTFWSDQLEVIKREEDDTVTFAGIYATVAASIIRNTGPESSGRSLLKTPHINQNDLPVLPKRWKDLAKHEFGALFVADAHQEIRNLESRNCWTIRSRAEAKDDPIPLKWVFTYKVDSEGKLLRCKSRLVVRGDMQYEDTLQLTYAATLASRSFRMAAALAAHFDLEMKQFDVVNAFVNAKREKTSSPVYCHLPDGFKEPGTCVEIDRALYGLRDSPALWYNDFVTTITALGLELSKEEPCLMYDEQRRVLVLFYVDDIVLLFHKRAAREAQEVIDGMKRSYELHEMGDCKWFLGVRVLRDRKAKTLSLIHDTYIEKVASRFELTEGRAPSTPLPTMNFVKYEGQATLAAIKEYQEKVGSILYTAIMIRADVAFAASQLSHFLQNPSPEHIAAINWAIRYLYSTRFLAIEYNADTTTDPIVVASDASFADDVETRRSSQGYTILLFGGLIAWRAARQDTVTTSTTEAELLALAATSKELVAIQRLFNDVQLDLGMPMRVFCDNQQTIRLVTQENGRVITKLRHVDIHNMWLRQEHQKNTFQVLYMATKDMPADGLTKNLPRYKFEHFRALLNLRDARARIEELE
jgi:hypothetical protein